MNPRIRQRNEQKSARIKLTNMQNLKKGRDFFAILCEVQKCISIYAL